MDYQAIIEALDARTLEAFKAWGDTFAAGMNAALDERDQTIAALAKRLDDAEQVADDLKHQLAQEREDAATRLSDTQKQVREAIDEAIKQLPTPVYRGVFDRDASYKSGDFVTHKGSVWHCNAATDGDAPGASDAWTLAVKCGRDGRDAKAEVAE